VTDEGIGVCLTRTGRRFFDNRDFEALFLSRLHTTMERSGMWDTLDTDWVLLDAELMPWSAKAQELLRGQYAAVGSAARAALEETVNALATASAHNTEVHPMLEQFTIRSELVGNYVDAYRRYCWSVESVDDLVFAPFHILAAEGKVHTDKDHLWHMNTLAALCAADPDFLLTTTHKIIDVTDEASIAEGIAWWEELTGRGGEGMVVKPLDFIVKGKRGLIQPAIKCRGREYLRIIYGAEYTIPENLERLRQRGLSAKRSLALREFALGIEGLERFVRGEPLRRVHECVFGVLALESEPVDPRL
jgi:protein phosphatase